MHLCVCARVFLSCARQEKLVPYQVCYLKGSRRRLSGVGVWWDVGVGGWVGVGGGEQMKGSGATETSLIRSPAPECPSLAPSFW